MGLDMSNATYARDRQGLNALRDEYFRDLTNTINLMRGDKYNELIRTIRLYWVGADADAFISQIDAQVRDSISKINTYRNKLDSALSQTYTNFTRFQNQNR